MDNLKEGQDITKVESQPDMGYNDATDQVVPTATPTPKTYKISKKKLTKEQEEKLNAFMDKEENKALDTYENYNNGQGWFNHIDQSTDDYETGGKIFSGDSVEGLDDVERKKLMTTTMMCDIVASKEKWQTQGAFPQILLVPKPQDKLPGADGKLKWESNDLSDRQDRLDYILRKDCKKEELNYVSSRMSCANGVSIEKYPYEKNVEYKTRRTTYKPENKPDGSMGNEAFEKLYAADLLNPKSKAFKNWDKIKAGEEVEITDVEPIVQSNGVKPYRVNLKKFIARLDIKDFRKHKVISEMIDTYSWADIEAKVATDDNDPYGYDQDAVARLKEKLGDKYLESENEVYESIVFTKFDSEAVEGEDKPKDRYQRYCITRIPKQKIVLKCIYYPYEHNDIYYVAKCAIPRDDSWAGYSFSTRLKDGKLIAEGLLNSMLRQFELSENGVILTNDNETDYSRIKINNGDGLSVIKAKTGANISQMTWQFPNIDRIGISNWVGNYQALLTGVDPALNSGAQTPDDPQAPMGKMLAKQKISDKRIEDIILNLQKSDELSARLIDYDYIQFVDEDKKPYFDGDYVCHGSTLSFNPEQDNQLIIAFDGWIGTAVPTIKQDLNYQYTMVNAMVNNAGGSIKKNKDIILKPLKDQLDLQEATQKAIMEFKAYGRNLGKSEEEINAAIPQMLAKLRGEPQQGQQGQAPQGQPPAQPGPPTEVIQ